MDGKPLAIQQLLRRSLHYCSHLLSARVQVASKWPLRNRGDVMGTTTIDTDELDRIKRCLAAYEQKDTERKQRFNSLKTPDQLVAMGKPFPMPGQVWRFDGTEQCPAPTGELTIIELRWFFGRAEVVFAPGDSVVGIEHMMELDAWVFVRNANIDEVSRKP